MPVTIRHAKQVLWESRKWNHQRRRYYVTLEDVIAVLGHYPTAAELDKMAGERVFIEGGTMELLHSIYGSYAEMPEELWKPPQEKGDSLSMSHYGQLVRAFHWKSYLPVVSSRRLPNGLSWDEASPVSVYSWGLPYNIRPQRKR